MNTIEDYKKTVLENIMPFTYLNPIWINKIINSAKSDLTDIGVIELYKWLQIMKKEQYSKIKNLSDAEKEFLKN